MCDDNDDLLLDYWGPPVWLHCNCPDCKDYRADMKKAMIQTQKELHAMIYGKE